METSVVSSKLSDGSKAWAVLFIDGSTAVRIECVDKASAYRLQLSFDLNASYTAIDTHFKAA